MGNNQKSKNNKSLLIICITVVVCIAIIVTGVVIVALNSGRDNEGDNSAVTDDNKTHSSKTEEDLALGDILNGIDDEIIDEIIKENSGRLNQIVVFVDYDADDYDVVRIERQIWSLDNVKSSTHISKDEVLESLIKNDYDRIIYSGIIKENSPIGDAFVIECNDVNDRYDLLNSINSMDGVSATHCMYDFVTRLENIKV